MITALGKRKGVFGHHFPERFDRKEFQTSDFFSFQTWFMYSPVGGGEGFQRGRRPGAEWVFKVGILGREFDVVIQI